MHDISQRLATIAKMTKAASIPLDTALDAVPGLPAFSLKMLNSEGINTVGDLVTCYPTRHEDRRSLAFKGFSPGETPVCHHVRILKTRVLRFGKGGGVFEVVVEAAQNNLMNQQLTLRWFKMTFLQKVLAVDMELMVYGKIKEIKARLIMDHPDYEVVRDEEDDATAKIHTGRLVPIYRLRGGLKQKPLRAAIWQVIDQLNATCIPDLLPKPKTAGEFAGMSRGKALLTLHRPIEQSDLEQAKRYLALEEFYLMQLRVVKRKLHFKQTRGWSQPATGSLATEFLNNLPFTLTEAQQRCLEEIKEDMAELQPMNRLLHGDVGSGKTVVALAAMLIAVEAGQQTVLMAPTQILAEQHYANALRWLEPLGIRVSLRTGSKREDGYSLGSAGRWPASAVDSTAEINAVAPLPSNEPHLLIGTHALLYGEESFARLGLVVIDEQHKFGVAQRTKLIDQGRMPDVLVMTATPIPRTLTLTLYGDLDVSTIDQRPKERGKVITAVREITKVEDVTKFVLTQLDEGRQCYIVYPLIEESEKLDASAAKTGFTEWSKRLAPNSVELLHGRMAPEEKESIMKRFRKGDIQALVSTTVIEVGVDVPNATMMLIHDAGRYGLAQLHQLRGRIGRGTHTSYAVLFIAKGDKESQQRLHILEETNDGFLIAEEDLRRRGPGDVLGQAQSGQAPLCFGEMLADTRLVALARQLAMRTLTTDPLLLKEEHANLRPFLQDINTSMQMSIQ